MCYKHAKINADSLRKSENELLDIWKSGYQNFIPDGCADYEKYVLSPVRLLFVLKEVNGGVNWDLRQFMKNGCRAQTWNVISRWIQNIYNLSTDFSWAELSCNNTQRRETFIPQVCAINVKKTPGTSVANTQLLNDSVLRDKAFLKKQVQMYKPDIIILCGTKNQYDCIMGNAIEWKMTTRGILYYIDSSNTIMISFLHPEARVKQCLLHYGLIDALKEILISN